MRAKAALFALFLVTGCNSGDFSGVNSTPKGSDVTAKVTPTVQAEVAPTVQAEAAPAQKVKTTPQSESDAEPSAHPTDPPEVQPVQEETPVPRGTVVKINQCDSYSCGYGCLTCGPSCEGEPFGSNDPAACAARGKNFCPSTWQATWPGPNPAWTNGGDPAYDCPAGTHQVNARKKNPNDCGFTYYECATD